MHFQNSVQPSFFIVINALVLGLAELGSSAGVTGPLRAVQRDQDSTLWEYSVPSGRPLLFAEPELETHSFVELASGLNYLDAQGVYQPSEPRFEIVDGRAKALRGPLKVSLAPNINVAGAIDITTAEGASIQVRPLAIAWFDSSSGNAVVLAQLQDSPGALVADNVAVYRDAFDGLNASIKLTYWKHGIEWDVVLETAPPAPSTFGLSDRHSRLEVWSELLIPGEASAIREMILREEKDPAARAARVEPDLVDETISIGSSIFMRGKAFSLPGKDDLIPVVKHLDVQADRSVLIEAVEYPIIEPLLRGLPKPTAAAGSHSNSVARTRVFPPRPIAFNHRSSPGLAPQAAFASIALPSRPG